jgi:hypothetical protein
MFAGQPGEPLGIPSIAFFIWGNMATGRPPKYETPEQMEDAIALYMAALGEDETPTISGLAYALGFTSRQSLYDYAEKEAFTYIIKRVCLKIESTYERALLGGKSNIAGVIFWLKNRGWRDTQTIDDVSSRKPETVTINWVGDAG